MSHKSEPWYIHAILYAIIAVLVFVLIKVAYLDPKAILEQEQFYKKESRLRMSNLRSAERLWHEKYNRYTDSIDSLMAFLKNDPSVKEAIEGVDSITGRPTNPFLNLSDGNLVWDSITHSPKSGKPYLLQVDTSVSIDTIIDRRGRIINIDTIRIIGQRYYIECPDGYGTIGDLRSDALQNTASWE
jgi:hypothetical protein